MKLNYDCVDAILLYVEENQNVFMNETKVPHFYDINKVRVSDVIATLKNKYDNEFSVYYSIQVAVQAGFILCEQDSNNKSFTNIIGLTIRGHERLKAIRSEERAVI